MKKVSYQGVQGAYSQSAAKKFFGEEIDTIGTSSFEDALKSAQNDKTSSDVSYSILPVENSIEGTVGQSIDEIVKTNLHAIGEVYLKVEHCLIGRGELDDITKVYSHPQALGQCSDFIENHGLKTVPTYDTAGSVEIIKDLENNCAAIASSLASNLYDVPIIKEGIANNSNNFTRFLIFSKEKTNESKNDKTSIIFSVKHEPGALYQILKEFNDNDINLTKIESRPNKNTNWEYNFFVDFLGHSANSKIKSVLDNIRKNTIFLKIIGSYPIAELD
ncbi:MAG: prephenate dehydratase [Candidatus Nitrosopelagicus brevis]|nr:prephenate dehydratase [Candidatus Nitrosopelagicus brevis]